MFLCGLLPCVDLSFYRIDCFLGRSVLCPCRVCLWCAGLPGVCLNEGGRCVLSVPGYGFLCFLFVSGMQWYGSAVVAGHVCNFNSE